MGWIKVRDLALPLLAIDRIADCPAELETLASIQNNSEGEVPCYRGG